MHLQEDKHSKDRYIGKPLWAHQHHSDWVTDVKYITHVSFLYYTLAPSASHHVYVQYLGQGIIRVQIGVEPPSFGSLPRNGMHINVCLHPYL